MRFYCTNAVIFWKNYIAILIFRPIRIEWTDILYYKNAKFSMDFMIYEEEKTFATVIKNAFYSTTSTVKMIWDSLYDLITGRYGVEAVSGPIGVTGAITDAAQTSTYSLFYLIVVITINLGVFNLIPFPALDGGTLLFLLFEMITRKPIPKKIEYGLKFAGFALLMLLVIFVSFKDIIGLFK